MKKWTVLNGQTYKQSGIQRINKKWSDKVNIFLNEPYFTISKAFPKAVRLTSFETLIRSKFSRL
jgi:hypothetical protein